MSLLKKTKNMFSMSMLMSMLFIISVIACDGCDNVPISQTYGDNVPISQTYGDLVMSVNKNKLTGEAQKKFVLSFLKEDEKLRTLLEDFELKVSVEQGKVSYSAYENGKSVVETGADFTKNLTHFFDFSELGVEGAINEKGEVEFTIVPDPSRVQTTRVTLELFKIDEKNREPKGSPLLVTWDKAESEIGIDFGPFYGLINNKEFQNKAQVNFAINNVGNDEISLEDIFIRLTSTAGEHQGASFTLTNKNVISGTLNNIEPFLLSSNTTKINKNALPRYIILQLDEEGGNSTSEVTLEIICGAKKIVKSLTWNKAILQQPQPVAPEDIELERLKKEKAQRQEEERVRQEAERAANAAAEERVRQEAEEQAERLANAAEAGTSVEEEFEILGNDASTSTSTSNSSIQLASSASVVSPAQQKPASADSSRPTAREDKGKEHLDLQDRLTDEQLLSQTRKNLKPTSEQTQQSYQHSVTPVPAEMKELQKIRSAMVEEGEKNEAKDDDEKKRDEEIMAEYSREEAEEDKLVQEDKQKDENFREKKRSTAKKVVIPRGQVAEGGRTVLLDAIINRANQPNANLAEAILLTDIHRNIKEGRFKPRFTLLPSLPSAEESPNNIQKIYAAGFDKMIAQVQISSDENGAVESSWDDEETITEEGEISGWYHIGSETQSSLNPAFKAKLKRLREVYRLALEIDPKKDWGWGKWLVWEYQHYNTPEDKTKIEETVDKYIEGHADELQRKFENLDISNTVMVPEQRKEVAQNGDMSMTLMPY